MKKLLFVCSGNTCRSPMAQALMTKKIADCRLDLVCDSAGVAASSRPDLNPTASLVLKKEYGILFSHKPQQLTLELMRGFDFVVPVSAEVGLCIKKRYGEQLPESVKLLSMPYDIIDPFGMSYDTYRFCAADISAAIAILLDKTLTPLIGSTAASDTESDI